MGERTAVYIIALAVTALAAGGLLSNGFHSSATASVSARLPNEHGEPLLEESRLVIITPRVGAAHSFILNHPDIEIYEDRGDRYAALVPVSLLPKLRTMADVVFVNQ